ncbi:MAC/perforin domain-containing protein [Pedobacter sp. P26]|uniref:MAC/perforin domain-containing protein n=1 Tax=Pedobacter sp. P26 TaxID=3423956 RepID=UPI003D6692C4
MKNNYKLKIICLLCTLTALFSNCKKNDLAEEKGLINKHNNLAGFGRDGKNDLLGYGYNVLGEFGNASAATRPVVDVDRLQADQSTRVIWDFSTRTEGRLDAGSDATSYLKKLTTHLSSTFGYEFLGMSLFKATVTGSYNSTDIFSSKYIYSSYNLKIQQKRIKLNALNDVLQSYLDPEFLSYIQSQTPEAIVNRYGTHVLADITLGGKLDVIYQSETSKSDKTTASSAGIDLHVKKIFNLNTGYTYDANDVSENFAQKLHYVTNGGDPTKNLIGDVSIGNASNPNPIPTVNISAWQNSCTLENSVLIDIAPDGLMPIYDLIPDQSKALAVKNYIIQYLTNNQGHLVDGYPVAKLYRCFNTKNDDRLLLTNPGEVGGVRNWVVEGSIGKVYTTNAKPGTVPLYRIYLNNGKHLFTLSWNEAHIGSYEGIVGYVNSAQETNDLPIYRYRNDKVPHLYTTSFGELGWGRDGWILEGNIGFIPQ